MRFVVKQLKVVSEYVVEGFSILHTDVPEVGQGDIFLGHVFERVAVGSFPRSVGIDTQLFCETHLLNQQGLLDPPIFQLHDVVVLDVAGTQLAEDGYGSPVYVVSSAMTKTNHIPVLKSNLQK